MSLNWNCQALTDAGFNIWAQRPANPQLGEEAGEYLNPVTDALIWATLIVGCDGRRIETFIQRVREYEIASGPLVNQPKDAEAALARNYIRADTFASNGYISKAELLRHKGLTTNVSFKTDAQWAKHLHNLIKEDATRTLNRELIHT